MGKQLQVLMSQQDEGAFLLFLRSRTEIQLIESFAPDTAGLFATSFSEVRDGHWSYVLWNKAFPWVPRFGTVGNQSHEPRHIGWRYVADWSTAPVLQFTRSDPASRSPGRIYWAKDFAAPSGLSYDVEAFAAWVEEVWRWVRKTGRKDHSLPLAPYVLPDARRSVALSQPGSERPQSEPDA